MREAVIVSTARTGLAKSVRGGFNMTHGAVMGGHAVKNAIARAGIDAKDVEDVFMGCALPEGATGNNVARASAIWAGCPVTTAGTTINRFCSSGLQAIAMAAQQIMTEATPIAVGSGVESISLVQMGGMNLNHFTEEHLMQVKPALWMAMIETAEIVAERYHVSRERQDAYSLESQRRTAAAQQAGRFKEEIVPLATKMKKVDRATGQESIVD
ncbi:MAG: thiolase family protein, partial [Rhizomicrobium sp.]